MTFSYELTWWNQFKGEHGESENIKGFIVAKNYFDATKKLLHSFGEEETHRFSLETFSPDDLLEFRNNPVLADYVKEQLAKDIIW